MKRFKDLHIFLKINIPWILHEDVLFSVAQSAMTQGKDLEEFFRVIVFAGSLEAAYSLNWGAREIWGKGGGETLALL